jgi:hypothetical protein|tara:strand:- start:201 stop:386 length:186 start_codon:yes stop_codon:yes gene_type:complete
LWNSDAKACFPPDSRPTEKQADGYHHLLGDWTRRPMPLFETQHIGAVVAVEAADEGVRVLL